MDLGVYIHFPFCRKRCPYCDFAVAVVPDEDIPHQRYTDQILAELAVRAPAFRKGRQLRSIYFGGGTPSLWHPEHIEHVIGRVWRAFDAPGTLEITLEANPNDCTPDKLAAWKRAGVNRVSVGVQDLADEGLVTLGRDHTAYRAREAVAAVKAAEFERVSVDLIYAMSGRTPADWKRTLEGAIALGVGHLSVYELTIEERTAFGAMARRGELVPKRSDEVAEAFELAHRLLSGVSGAGYEHYEVSAYAKPGEEAIHNSLYWSGGDYLGLGNGAHSFQKHPEGARRWSSHRSVKKYLGAEPFPDPASCPLVDSHDEETLDELRRDLVWLGLRTQKGVMAGALAGREAEVELLVSAGLLTRDGDRIRPTLRGFLMADTVAAELCC